MALMKRATRKVRKYSFRTSRLAGPEEEAGGAGLFSYLGALAALSLVGMFYFNFDL